ncbi:hypothetical protein PHJA_000105100 [Phtheirospermum japonicum]|uniref:Uncharacterized protein n=1 Tax=Phtheirospermum japonicum TaxID=374723 RepID=A0A830AZF1_9LAMI|nr:hypothetical protein PHJA_000105100 [Phtheirospermum japonicum]
MANEEGKDDPPRGNEWEVVSLTASAYAAAPGPQQVDPNEDSPVKLDSKHEAETSSPLFMSRHFVFPPSQHENLPLEPEYNEKHNEKEIEDDVSQLVQEEAVKSEMKDDETVAFEGLISNEFPGIPIFDDKGNFGNDVAQSIYTSAEFDLFRNDAGEGEGTDDSTGPTLDSADDSGLQDFEKLDEGDEHDVVDLPCEAWWKRRAVSLYAHAKEANTFWSIFVAAAVMGLVIIGHQWQQERWKVLHLRQFGIKDERMGRMLGPISRFKDVIVGGHRRGSLVRGGASTER